MICPHCNLGIHLGLNELIEGEHDRKGAYIIESGDCPVCGGLIVTMQIASETTTIYPRSSSRPHPPQPVIGSVKADFIEACLVHDLSPKASAALSRRCLQSVLVEKLGAPELANLYDQIESVLQKVPSYISERLHYVREVGNFSAHPRKSTNTGEIMDVEPEEATVLLNTLESLFDHCYVQPEKFKSQKEALNNKLVETGKKPIE